MQFQFTIYIKHRYYSLSRLGLNYYLLVVKTQGTTFSTLRICPLRWVKAEFPFVNERSQSASNAHKAIKVRQKTSLISEEVYSSA